MINKMFDNTDLMLLPSALIISVTSNDVFSVLSPEGLDTILSLIVQTGVAVTIWSKFINWHRNKKNK